MAANYWVAQHIKDTFRNEPRNVGIFVQLGDRIVARFFGESDDRLIDGRRLRGFQYPEVYKQWVEYWRSQLAHNDAEALIANSGSHYRVVKGGNVTDTAEDTPNDILNYLYSMLVSEGGLREAIGTEELIAETSLSSLEEDISRIFKMNNLLGDGSLIVRHPVRRSVAIRGLSTIEHKPAFVQENGRLYVIEQVDFTTSRKKTSKDHAGLSAYMFRDIRNGRQDTENIAIVNITEADQGIEEVVYGLKLLKNEAKIVHWQNTKERDAFLEERKAVATTE